MFIRRAFQMKSQAPQGTKSQFPIRNGRGLKSQSGFTLIEMIATLVLVAILAAVGGMAIVQAVKGYMTVKENSATTQKAQLAMTRITREIIDMINIPSAGATATAITINNINGNRTIGLDSVAKAVKVALAADTTDVNAITALDSATLSDTLIDNVSAFTLTYSAGGGTWTTASDITELTAIDVLLTLTRPDGVVLTFTNKIAPRNNKNQGGASPIVSPPSLPSYGCFVATAAYGDSGHPMVQILRDFRDRQLLSWQAGRWFVKQYYEHGPAAADMISNRPVTMWAVRCLLAPVVALVFCLMYAPMAIPFILIVSLFVTGAIFSALRSGIPLGAGVIRARGSVLVGLIFTMVIMATLGAAMLPIFSASYMNQAYADQGRKTYFVAESGFRYAASQFLAAKDNQTLQDTVMIDLNGGMAGGGKTCNLLDNAGSFTTKIYPYWFKAQAALVKATTLTTQVYGTIPTEFSTTGAGKIRVGNSYYSYTGRTITPGSSGAVPTITFALSSSIGTAVAAGVDVQPWSEATGGSLAKSGSLTLSGDYSVLPLLNGNFVMYNPSSGLQIQNGAVFNYTKRIGATLYNVTISDGIQNGNWTSTLTIPASTKVVLDRFVRLSSTGTIGNASREVIYNVPVGFSGSSGGFHKAAYQDKFDSGANWFTGTEQSMGTHVVTGGAMKVSGVVDPTTTGSRVLDWLAGIFGWGNDGLWGFVALNWGNTNTNLAQSWMDAGGCLSYDLQVKMNNTQKYFMTGMGFRMRNNLDGPDANSTPDDLYTYGVSFIRQRQTRYTWTNLSDWGYEDGINNALRPPATWTSSESIGWPSQARYSEPMIVLWQRNGPATGTGGFKILAYRTITAADNLTTGTGVALRLNSWASLMVRVIEGYELPFTRGLVDGSSTHLKYGDIITNLAGTKTARVVGTPILTQAWGTTTNTISAEGTLILTNRPVDSTTGASNNFTSGEDLYLVGGETSAYARAGTQATTKANYIMVYYSNDQTPVAGDAVQANNIRIGNPLEYANWPPDDWTNMAAGLPTADPAGNDYFSLVQWRYAVSGSGLSLSVTPANGWSYSAPSLSRVAAYGTPITPSLTSGWTLESGWVYGASDLRRTSNNSTSSATYPVSTTAGTKYDVTMTIYRTNNNASASYTFGGVSGGNISGTNGTSVNYGPTTFTAAGSTTNFIITGNNNWRGRLTALSVTPHITAADQPVTATITSGTTYDVAVNVSSLTAGSFYYTIGGCTSSTCTTGSCNLTCTASNTNPLTFYSPGIDNRFTISSFSITTAATYADTLNTSPDSQGNVASYVDALSTTDFYKAVIKTSALLSPTWYPASTTGPAASTTTNFIGPYSDPVNNPLSGDGVTLVTSSSASNTANSTFYDDFAIQLDMKAGTGFLPPIQQ